MRKKFVFIYDEDKKKAYRLPKDSPKLDWKWKYTTETDRVKYHPRKGSANWRYVWYADTLAGLVGLVTAYDRKMRDELMWEASRYTDKINAVRNRIYLIGEYED